jgi:hypothetical protein
MAKPGHEASFPFICVAMILIHLTWRNDDSSTPAIPLLMFEGKFVIQI